VAWSAPANLAAPAHGYRVVSGYEQDGHRTSTTVPATGRRHRRAVVALTTDPNTVGRCRAGRLAAVHYNAPPPDVALNNGEIDSAIWSSTTC